MNTEAHAHVDPWTGGHREQIARAAFDLHKIAVEYEQGRGELPEAISPAQAVTITDPAQAARRYAWELFRGDCRATRMQIKDINRFLEEVPVSHE